MPMPPQLGIVDYFPAFAQIAIDDARLYPVYATCVELGLAFFVCAGVPGPRLELAVQHVERIDRVMAMGLSLERIVQELALVPFRDSVWPKFLRANALRVLGLADPAPEPPEAR